MQSRFLTSAMSATFVVLWSSAFIAGIIGVGVAPPMMMLFARFSLAGIALTLYALAVRAAWPRGRQLAHAAVAGLLMQMTQFGGFYSAMRFHVTGAVIALIQGLNPVVIALLAGALLAERVTLRQWLGFVIGGLGVLLAVSGQVHLSVAGVLFCVIGLLGLTLGTIYQKRYTPAIDSRAATAVHALVSAPVAGLLAWLGGDLHVARPGSFALVLVWIVLINSMAAFLLLNAMLGRWEATRVSRLFFAVPATTTVLAWLVIGQRPSAATMVGLAVGLFGMVLAARRTSEPAPARATVLVASR